MGKKNFIENYDPLRAHLNRDAERVVLPAQAAPPLPDAPAPEVIEPIRQPKQQKDDAPPRRQVARKVVPIPAPRVEAPTFAPEVSARIKVTEAAFQDLEAMLANLHRTTGSKIHYSIATRALWGLLVQAEAQVTEELRKASLGRLPSTRAQLAYAEYEEKVRLAFANAFRKLPRSVFSSPQEGMVAEG